MTHFWTEHWLRRLGADPAPPEGYGGRWPTTSQGLLWDLLPKQAAPPSDGVIAPTHAPPAWPAAATESDLDGLLALERQRAEAAAAAAATVEGKASRLLATTVTLLTASVALTALQLQAAANAHGLVRLLLIAPALPGAVACLLAVLSAVRSLDADLRVGVYGTISGQLRAEGGMRAELESATLGATTAEWTARNKASALMDARAWFTRALAAVLLGLVLAAVTVTLSG